MSKGYQGRHKGDIAIDNLMRDAKNAKYKERNNIQDETILTKCLAVNKPNIVYKDTPKDSNLTAFVAGGIITARQKEKKKKRDEALEEKRKEAELQDLSDFTGVSIDLLRKNSKFRKMGWEGDEIELAKRQSVVENESKEANNDIEPA